ncbi:hypothetical protein ACFQV2_16430 [Actinokineospora soli]|uniref:FG-GAP repeat-containing protein n=1 Tax=Actinokineospora soli TaxID=1048753 RepID=A0ABW2TNY5_9PSEU
MRSTLIATAIATATGIAVAVPGVAAADGQITWTTANSTATGDQDGAAVAVARTGYTAVVWEDDRDSTNPTDPLHSDVFLRLYRDGVSLYEKKLSAGGTGNWTHVEPDVALREDGTAVVVFATDGDGNGAFQIAVRTVNTAGTVTGSATANANSAGQQTVPAVAADPEGPGFAVAFQDQQTGAAPTVRLSGFASITAKTYEVAVHAAGGTHRRPDVAMGAAGNAIVVWDEDGDGNGFFNIARKVFTPSGGVKLAQASANANGGGQQRNATVAANFNGDFAVAWETDHTGVAQTAARSFTATGTAGPETPLPGKDPQVGIDDQRAVFVAWEDAADVHGQGINPDGTTTGRQPRLLVHPTTAGSQTQPAAGVDAWGRVVLAFTDDNDGNGFDQVYLGTGLVNSTW